MAKKTKKVKKKSPAEILGLSRIPLNIKSCKERAKLLRRRVEAGEFTAETASLARRWASWYQAKANQLQKGAKKKGKTSKRAA